MSKLKLQSDESFAENFTCSHAHWGARRILFELKRRGISENLIEKFLPQDIDELKKCRDVLEKKLHGAEISSGYSEKQKLAAFLARRGFNLDVIREVLGF